MFVLYESVFISDPQLNPQLKLGVGVIEKSLNKMKNENPKWVDASWGF